MRLPETPSTVIDPLRHSLSSPTRTANTFRRTAVSVSLLLSMLSPAEADQYGDEIRNLEKFATEHPIGGQDYWLMILNAFGNYEKAALMFGMASDLAFCWSIADAYRARYPNIRLICLPANEPDQ